MFILVCIYAFINDLFKQFFLFLILHLVMKINVIRSLFIYLVLQAIILSFITEVLELTKILFKLGT